MRKKNLITFFSLFAISGSLISPAKSHYNRTSFGEGTAAFACFLLWEGYPKYEVESLISIFERTIEKSNFSEVAISYEKIGYNTFFTLFLFPVFWFLFNLYQMSFIGSQDA